MPAGVLAGRGGAGGGTGDQAFLAPLAAAAAGSLGSNWHGRLGGGDNAGVGQGTETGATDGSRKPLVLWQEAAFGTLWQVSPTKRGLPLPQRNPLGYSISCRREVGTRGGT